MPAYRDHPRRGAALAAETTYLTGAALSAGTAASFLLILIIAIAGEETLGAFYDDFDPIFRAGIGIVSVAFVLGLGVTGYGLAASRVSGARQLARAAQEEPELVATWNDRRDLETKSPFTFAYIYTAWMVGLGALALLIMGLALQETLRYNPEEGLYALQATGGVAAFVVLCALLAFAIRTMARPRWLDAVATVDTVWGPRARSAASRAERSGRPGDEKVDLGRVIPALRAFARVVSRAAGIGGAAGGILFFIDVVVRQPCRRCDQVYYDRPIESAIDVVMFVAVPIIMLSLAAGALALIAGWVAAISERVTLLRLADAGSRSPRPAQLLPTLTQLGPGEHAGLALIAVAGGLIPVAIATLAVTDAPDARAWLLGLTGIVAAGIATLAVSITATGRVRNRLREVWSPGDPVPPRPDARRKTTPTRDAGDGYDGDAGGDGGGD